MDDKTPDHFAHLIALAQATFEHVDYVTDATPVRSILRLQATYGPYRIVVTELLSDDLRQYRYYVLRGDWVEAGFDNSPDPRAIRLKYGRIGMEHAGEFVPHLHRQNKASLSLTEEMSFETFIEWLSSTMPLS